MNATTSTACARSWIACLDTGRHAWLLDAASFIRTAEERQDLKIACMEEIAWRMGVIDEHKMRRLCDDMRGTDLAAYLTGALKSP